MEAAMLLSVRQESQTCDEAYNLFAGYEYLTAGDFSISPAHPPLSRDVGALPLLALRPIVPPMPNGEAGDFRGGRVFVYANRAEQILFDTRAAMTVFPLLMALLIFLAAREMFGPEAAMVALALAAFEPNFLAHGPLLTNDVALATCLFAAAYAFWRYVQKPGPWRLGVCGIACGLTLVSKHSGLILFPILLLLALVELATAPAARATTTANGLPPATSQPAQRRALRLAMALAVIAAISFAVLWSFYDLRYADQPTGPGVAPMLASVGSIAHSRLMAFSIAHAARFHLLPQAFLEGLVFLLATESRPTCLLGTRYLHGVWFYFPTVLAIKCTLGFLLLLALALFARLARSRESRREALWMLVPAAVFLAATVTSNLNIGVRHVLPIFPFLIVWAAAGAWKLAKSSRAALVAVSALVLLHVASSLRAYPDYLPYSNELWGGPSQTYRVLTDSNVDWGQSLPAVKRYLAVSSSEPCWMAYFGTVDPAYFGIPCSQMPVETAIIWGRPLREIPPTIEGTVLVSATEMSGQFWGPDNLNPYEQFRLARPTENLGGSILVYHGKFEVPLASALSRVTPALALSDRGEFDSALAELHAAEALAPQSVDVQFALGRVFKAAGRADDARQAFQNALRLATTIHPESQPDWIPIIRSELAK